MKLDGKNKHKLWIVYVIDIIVTFYLGELRVVNLEKLEKVRYF